MARLDRWWPLLLLACGCSVPGYSPYPLDLAQKMPADAFSRCRAVLLSQYGALTEADAADLRFETAWKPISDPVGERRALVFRDASREDSLSIVVELRWLSVPLVGVPHWTTARGDDRAERALAELLRESLRTLAPPDLPPMDQPPTDEPDKVPAQRSEAARR